MLENVFKERRGEREPSAPSAPARRSFPALAALIVPLPLLLLVLLITYLFGWISLDRREPFELLEETRAASGERRALVAFELSRLESLDLPGPERQRFVQAVSNLLQSEAGGDPRVRRALTLVLGRIGDPSSLPALISAAEDADVDTRIYALWALGAARRPEALAPLVAHLQDDDATARKTAAFALGELADPRANASLQVALRDPIQDVQWNAAISLARLGDEAGIPVLLPLLSGYLPGQDLSPAQAEELRINVVRSLRGLRSSAVKTALEKAAGSDPSGRVRTEARLALANRPPTPFTTAPDVASPR